MNLRMLVPAAAVVALSVGPFAAAQDVVRRPLHVAGQAGAAAGVPVMQRANTFEFIAAGPAFGGELTKDAPYSAEAVTETRQTLADGNRISRTNTSKIYRDSQGRTRREQQIGAIGPWSSAGEPSQVVFINDPVAGVNYVLHPNERTAQKIKVHLETVVHEGEGAAAEKGEVLHWVGANETVPPPPPPPPGVAGGTVAYRHMQHEVKQGEEVERDVTVVHSAVGMNMRFAEGDMQTESLGTRMIEGVEAEGTRTTTTIPAGQIGNEQPIEIVSESWYSPQLKTVVLSTHNDPRMGETVYRLTNIQLVEPLAMLFEPPADYTIQEGPQMQYFQRRLEHAIQGEDGAKQ